MVGVSCSNRFLGEGINPGSSFAMRGLSRWVEATIIVAPCKGRDVVVGREPLQGGSCFAMVRAQRVSMEASSSLLVCSPISAASMGAFTTSPLPRSRIIRRCKPSLRNVSLMGVRSCSRGARKSNNSLHRKTSEATCQGL